LVGWAVTIFVLSSLPQVSRIPLPYHLDKLAHAVVYGVLAWTAHRAFHHQHWWEAVRRRSIILTLVFATLYGLTDELHQSFVPGRVSSHLDLFADVFGAGVAVILIAWRRRSVELRSASD
jgi:VanZ family protein